MALIAIHLIWFSYFLQLLSDAVWKFNFSILTSDIKRHLRMAMVYINAIYIFDNWQLAFWYLTKKKEKEKEKEQLQLQWATTVAEEKPGRSASTDFTAAKNATRPGSRRIRSSSATRKLCAIARTAKTAMSPLSRMRPSRWSARNAAMSQRPASARHGIRADRTQRSRTFRNYATNAATNHSRVLRGREEEMTIWMIIFRGWQFKITNFKSKSIQRQRTPANGSHAKCVCLKCQLSKSKVKAIERECHKRMRMRNGYSIPSHGSNFRKPNVKMWIWMLKEM